MSILGVLLVLFIALKLIGLITWSWWAILAPLWIWFAILIFQILAFLFVGNGIKKMMGG